MSAAICVAEHGIAALPANPPDRSVLLGADGYCFFLYRYFEGANLDHRSELIDLYGDVSTKPERWLVLTGRNEHPALENEIWREVQREKMIQLIRQITWLIEFAKERKLKLICSGD